MEDYLYGSAHIRALEVGILGREKLARLTDAKSVDECYAALAEYGVNIPTEAGTGRRLREEALLGILKGAYDEVSELAPESDALNLWRYPYDCNNIKAVIKCKARGVDPAPMLFDFGTVPVTDLLACASVADCEGFPSHLHATAAEAIEAFSKTANPQVVDLTLDRACFADMLEAAQKSKNEFVVGLVRAKIDLTNLMICVRVLRMKGGEAGKILLRDALIPGGALEPAVLTEWFLAGEKYLWERVGFSDYSKLAERVGSSSTLTEIERNADDAWMEQIRAAKLIPLGVEVMVAYLLAREYEVRNLRIVLAGKEAGISADTIRERIRGSYV